jgi:hypothetical protein
MIILGFALVAFGVLLETQALWVLGSILVAAGAALALFGVVVDPRSRRYLPWTHRTHA